MSESPAVASAEPAGPHVAGRVRLLQYFGLVVLSLAVWVALLLAAFGKGPAVLLHAGRLPGTAIVLYGTGLYVILLGAAAWVWTRDGGRIPFVFSGPKLFEGLAVGGVSLAVLLGVQAALGWISMRTGTRLAPVEVLSAAAVAMAFAVSEEILFRGFILGLLARDLPPGAAIVASAAIFALAHFLHPLDLRSVALPFIGLLCAGAVLASMRLRSRSLWPGVGLHASWVWYITVTGQTRLLALHAPAWTQAGSLAANPLALAALGLIYLWFRRRYPARSSSA